MAVVRALRATPRKVAGPALIVAAVVFLGWSGWSFWQVDRGEGPDLARDRDQVMAAGKQQIATLNSMDGGRVDAGLQRWLDSSTGPLRDELLRTRGQSRRQIQQARTSAQGTVLDIAVTAVDRRAGSAQIIASVRIEITDQTGAVTVQRKRYQAGMSRIPAGWRLKSLTAIPVNAV